MKKFILGFILGIIILIIVSNFKGLITTTLKPITTSPFTLWCDQLVKNPSQLGNVAVFITQNGQPVSDLTISLSVKKPLPADHPGAAPGEFRIPEKACFVGTNNKGVGTFTKVPAGTAYLFFNNDPAAYPKRFGVPNYLITTVEVTQGKTTSTTLSISH